MNRSWPARHPVPTWCCPWRPTSRRAHGDGGFTLGQPHEGRSADDARQARRGRVRGGGVRRRPALGPRSSSGSAIKPTASIAQTHTAPADGSTSRLRKISMLSAMSPMRPRRTGSLAQAGNLAPYAHRICDTSAAASARMRFLVAFQPKVSGRQPLSRPAGIGCVTSEWTHQRLRIPYLRLTDLPQPARKRTTRIHWRVEDAAQRRTITDEAEVERNQQLRNSGIVSTGR